MINKSFAQDWLARSFAGMVMIVGLFLCQATNAAVITLSVEASNPDTTLDPMEVPGFRYMVEEDTTYKPNLNVQDDYESLSFQFHRSHNPVATNAAGQAISGFSDTSNATITVPDNGRYFISVTPFEGHTMGGGSVEVGSAAVSKTIRVNTFPLPTAQISIWIFEDNNPVNGALDLDESRLATTDIDGQAIPFTINLFDAAGQYGAAGGHVTQDAYGNPLGTEYAPNGDVTSTPDNTNGFVLTPNANGELIIKHLPPAKYGIQVVPPAGPVGEPIWVQTSTIEGSRTIDAWVKAGEPSTFVEFGPPGPHVFVGFVQEFDCLAGVNADANCFNTVINADGDPVQEPVIDASGDGATINGQIVNNHMSRPPAFDFANGEPFEGCRIAVNIGIAGRTIYSQPCGDEAKFSVTGLPVGSYSLSIWDDGLNAVIANHAFNVAGNATDGFSVSPATQLVGEVLGTLPATVECTGVTCELGQIPVFDWFHFADTSIFVDTNENGFWDAGEKPLNADASQTILRFRDGRIYTALPIDFTGAAPLEEVFPFFHWLVAEVGFANHKATGATFIVDAGGDSGTLPADGYVAQPQTVPPCGNVPADQPEDCSFDGGLSRTEKGQVLTAAFQGFLGQKNIMQFGKKAYAPGENGGISGVAVYAITRAEDDPAYAAAEEWEPGIPRVQVALFKSDRNEAITNANGVVIAQPQQPDVDNHPLGWGDGTAPMGPEDTDRSCAGAQADCVAANPVFDWGDAIDVTWTDSWDDSQPENCAGANQLYATAGDADTALIPDDRCFDGLRNFNQIRPGVFDGGYAFGGTVPHLTSGYYIVQAYTPPGYELMREEHKNVDFGDEYAVSTLLPPACVGAEHMVPDLLAFVTVPDASVEGGFRQVYDIGNTADYEAPYAGLPRRLCDARHIRVADGKNAAADFHFMTPVNKAAHVVGGVINDLGNEFNPLAPTFGEKFAPPWVPVAFYDYKGHEITRVYSDQFGKYNAMLPSTNTVNVASPSGVAPNMVTACMNDGGLVDTDGDGVRDTTDPNYNPQYSQFCYVFQYMPGGTTYLDTPVQQIAAFAGGGLQLDCAAANQTPLISEVTGPQFAGPYAQAIGDVVTIKSPGKQLVPNPSSDELTEKFIVRDYGFGLATRGGLGKVQMIRENNISHAFDMPVLTWSDTEITVVVPRPSNGSSAGRFQLVVTNAAGFSSPMGVTLTLTGYGNGSYLSRVHEVFQSQSDNATPIQDAIDAASPGDTILVTAGTYNEIPIMWKPLYLQGAGAYSTTINARSAPTEIVANWHAKMDSLLGLNGGDAFIDLLPGQEIVPGLFATEAAAGVTVVAPQFGDSSFGNSNNHRSRIDGFKITGASTGGGIFVNGYVNYLYASNNLITGNQGTFGGGIRLGHPTLTVEVDGGLVHDDAHNDSIRIRHNMITQNGGMNGAGGGISIYTGADDYRVNNNLICGNFAATDGAGIGHLGKSARGRIEDNTIIFNQSFRQSPGFETDGGGILIAGKDVLADNVGLNPMSLSDGSGHDIRIYRNLIQGNQAGAGDGGGIALRSVNGTDIENDPNDVKQWNQILIRNNSIVNNMAGLAGGGISLRDAVRVNIQHNTIANNESTATAGAAFETDPEVSTPQPAGIVARAHSPTVADAIELTNNRYGRGYSSPILTDNIIWHNRSSHYVLNTNELVFDVYSDLGIVPEPTANWRLTPRASLLSNANGYHSDNMDDIDVAGTQVFVEAYLNGNPRIGPSPQEFNTIQVAPALDEGGNWIDVRYAPLSINDVVAIDGSASFGGTGLDTPSDYHLFAGSVAIDNATGGRSGSDIDRDPLGVSGDGLDMGSDEVQ
jgi:hypothetical protein